MTEIKKGVIEGFYGIPWTFEQRYSMINFLSDINMNQYIYAPKDGPYHNVKWRDLYPDNKLKELEKLAKLAQRKNIDFVWAIHPGQNLIDFSDYKNEIERIYKKYEQLHSIGIKSFALCMDDVDQKKAYEQREYHLQLVKDILNFISDFENRELLFVHPWYNQSWIDDKACSYFELFKNIKNLKIMWTGYDVVAPLRYDANEEFIKLANQKPNIWFNWPVNDYKRDQIFMEIFEFFDSRSLNFDSFLINPMNQAELSKLSIFQINEYLKDPSNYKAIEVFKKGLIYLDKDVADDLYLIADSFFGSDIYSREENKKYFEDSRLAAAFKARDYEKIIYLIDQKLEAIDNYESNYSNQNLYKEVISFFTSLKYLLKAVKCAINKDYSKAADFYKKSKECKVRIYKEFSLDEIEDRVVKTSSVLEEIYKKLMESKENL